tara:strand:+ start:252 stop:632 length:381 start_codon:yes stop_codon:yes gene_type:complete
LSVYPTPIINFYSDSEIEAGDGIVNVINRPIVLKSFYLNVSDQDYDNANNSFTVKMFDGTDEIIRIYDGADSTIAHQGTYGSIISNLGFKFPSNGIRILNSLALSIANSSVAQPFKIESISVMYQG